MFDFLKSIGDIGKSINVGLDLYKTYQDVTGPDINYDLLQIKSTQKDIEATSVLNRVVEEADFIREQFAESVGAYQAMKAKRGVKVGVGGVAEGLERSAKAEGEDIQTLRKNARFKYEQLKSQGRQYKKGAEDQKDIDYWGDIRSISKGISDFSKKTNKKS